MNEPKSESYNAVVPEEWRREYSDLSITTENAEQTEQPAPGTPLKELEPEKLAAIKDRLYGDNGDVKTQLSWEELDRAVEERFGYSPQDRQDYHRDPEGWEKYYLRPYRYQHGLETEPEEGQLHRRLADLETKFAYLTDEFIPQLEARNGELARRNQWLEDRLEAADGRYQELVRVLESRPPAEAPPRRRSRAVVVLGALAAAALLGMNAAELARSPGKADNSKAIATKLDRNYKQEMADARIDQTILANQDDIKTEQTNIKRQIHTYGDNILDKIKNLPGQKEHGAKSAGDLSAYQYPWDWAHEVYGPDAERQLHILGRQAAADGHSVRWIERGYLPNGNIDEILQIDGTFDTQQILQVLSQYR